MKADPKGPLAFASRGSRRDLKTPLMGTANLGGHESFYSLTKALQRDVPFRDACDIFLLAPIAT